MICVYMALKNSNNNHFLNFNLYCIRKINHFILIDRVCIWLEIAPSKTARTRLFRITACQQKNYHFSIVILIFILVFRN